MVPTWYVPSSLVLGRLLTSYRSAWKPYGWSPVYQCLDWNLRAGSRMAQVRPSESTLPPHVDQAPSSFMGSNMFCLKACDPSKSDDEKYCQHIYDTQGCGFNAPSNAKDGVFESCASDNQPIPGEGPAIPPQSSQCSTFASTDIYGPSATVRVPIPGASTISFSSIPRPTPTASSSSSPSSSATTSNTGSGTSAPQETAGNAAVGISASHSLVFGAMAAFAGIHIFA